MAKQNLQKKELNRQIGAALFSDTERMEMWFIENWKKVLGIAIIVLVAVTATFGVWKYQEYRKEVAANALQNAVTIEALEKDLATYGNSDAAPAARYRLASLLLRKGDYKNAAVHFQKVADDPKSSPDLAENARFAKITATELAGDLKQAATDYAAMGNDAKVSPAKRAAADHAAARLLLDLGDIQGASAILAKERLIGGSIMLGYWNGQLDALALAVKNGDYKDSKK